MEKQVDRKFIISEQIISAIMNGFETGVFKGNYVDVKQLQAALQNDLKEYKKEETEVKEKITEDE